jgi:hypothetical protein
MLRVVTVLMLIGVVNGLPLGRQAAADPVPRVEPFLIQGRLAEGELDLKRHLQTHPDDDQARFGLGVLQFLRGVETLGQSLHQFGARPRPPIILGSQIPLPILRLPVPSNSDPEQIAYEDVRRILQVFGEDLQRAEATLSAIRDDNVRLPLHFGEIRLDLNGSGKIESGEELWRIYARYTGQRPNTASQASADFVVCFDRGDVHWLRGYCHLLTAMTEVALAYDWSRAFEVCGHMLFPKIDSPSAALEPNKPSIVGGIMDLVAFVHLIDLPLVSPERSRAARQHLLIVIQQSRESWAAIAAETDDDREWVPNAGQTSVVPGARVSEEMIDGWQEFLNETQDLLEGRKLVPFWRGDQPNRGVNLAKVFLEPREFDLILWIHGVAAVPYLEEGQCTDPETWQRLQRVFGGDYSFLRYAVWFN